MYQADFIMEGRLHLNYFDKKWNYFHRVGLPDTSQKIASNMPITRSAEFAFPYKKNEFNKHEIIQNGDSIIIKVNDFQILHKPIRRIYGNKLGIQQCLKSAWVMDRIVVKQDTYY